MEPMHQDHDERTKTKRVYDERVVDKESFQAMEEADYDNMPDFDAGESRFAPPDAVILSSLRIEPPFLLDFRKKSLVPAQEIACQCEKGSEVLRASVARAVRRHERKRASRALARGG